MLQALPGETEGGGPVWICPASVPEGGIFRYSDADGMQGKYGLTGYCLLKKYSIKVILRELQLLSG